MITAVAFMLRALNHQLPVIRAKTVLLNLSDNHLKHARINTVTNHNDKSGPGGSGTHDLSNVSYFLSEGSNGKRTQMLKAGSVVCG
jgi:hypothetical protein